MSEKGIEHIINGGALVKYFALIIVLISLIKIIMKNVNTKFVNDNEENIKIEKQKTYKVIIYIASCYLATRLVIFIAAYCFHVYKTNTAPYFTDVLKELWYRWDSPHYVSIAANGYLTSGDERYFIVFFPLYPLIIRIMHFIINDYFLCGIVVSNFFALLSLYYLFRLVELEYEDSKTARRTIKYLLIFPFSFFFSIVYTESLFLALSVMCFYYARKRRFFISGIFGMLSALTRNQGVLLIIPILIEILEQNNIFKGSAKHGFNVSCKDKIMEILSLALVPLGYFLYLALNKCVTGNWFKFLQYQKENWHQSFGFFAGNVEKHYLNIFYMEWKTSVGIWIPQLILFFLVAALLIYNINRMRLSYSAYTLSYIIISYSATWLLSGPRYLSGMFTLYIMLSNVRCRFKSINVIIDVLFIFLLCFYSIQFYLWNVY